jgi:GTP-binding protein
MKPSQIRNVAIIAHVDHGKTTLVDALFRFCGVFRDNQAVAERIMDKGDQERERGITISAKNCAVQWSGYQINILDTPGHADFGGEVERALSMVDGAILLIDAAEGPLPQTRFVLEKALKLGLKIILCINKIDRSDARAEEILSEAEDLFLSLDATESQLGFPVLYSIGIQGRAGTDKNNLAPDLTPLLETLVEYIPAPSTMADAEEARFLVSSLDYSDFLGQLAVGRLLSGELRKRTKAFRYGKDARPIPTEVQTIQRYRGIGLESTDIAYPGEILLLSGIEGVEIGDTISTSSTITALPRISIDPPTVEMRFFANNSPFSGKEGSFIHPQKLAERLLKESLRNVSLNVEKDPNAENFLVRGRGEFQLAVLIEEMRREGFELGVARPSVVFKQQEGVQVEPIEEVSVECDEQHTGVVTEYLSRRRSVLQDMRPQGDGRMKLVFEAPARALLGYHSKFLTDTRGTGMLFKRFLRYAPVMGEIPGRTNGSLVSDREGDAVAYALFHLEPRGKLFIRAGVKVYAGMVIGEHNRPGDLLVNPCKGKKLTNMRASGKDEAVVLSPIQDLGVEDALAQISDDELLEVTPQSVRMRKKILPRPRGD